MRRQFVFTALLCTSLSSAAFAQMGTSSATGIPLNEQLRLMQQKNGVAASPTQPVTSPSTRPADIEVTKPDTAHKNFANQPGDLTSPPAMQDPSNTSAPLTSATMPAAPHDEMIDSVGNGAIPSLPIELISTGNVSYLSGGISDEENDQLKAQAANFNLQILITGMHGEFASDVNFSLMDHSGKELLSFGDAGPKVYVKLPAGEYTVKTMANGGAEKTMHVRVPASGAAKAQIHIG